MTNSSVAQNITFENQSNLPNGWTSTTISDVCVELIGGG